VYNSTTTNKREQMKTIKIPQELWKKLKEESLNKEIPIYKIIEQYMEKGK